MTSHRLHIHALPRRPNLRQLLHQLRSYEEYAVMGDFAADSPSRYSYGAVGPSRTISLPAGPSQGQLEVLKQELTSFAPATPHATPVPFVGGWIGYFSYDMGHWFETIPQQATDDLHLPWARLAFYDNVLAWDHLAQRGYLLAWEYPDQAESVPTRLERWHDLLDANGATEIPAPTIDLASASRESLLANTSRNISPTDYLAKVERARQYIIAGDIFEVNLSQRFARAFTGDIETLYAYLTEHNPAAYAALIKTPDHALVSASPELFLQCRGREILTRPIKGTRPRGHSAEQDRALAAELMASEKEQAELNMIIDLERNDLGRICEYGSVAVLDARRIEQHPTVFHAVADIAGTLRQDVDMIDVLRATFPGGSITGAPKIRSMEIIDELEPTARSVYTGSIGWLGCRGDFDLNIAIRTIILRQGHAYVQAGGAVVYDSDPQAEYDETLAKSAALLAALQAVNPI